MKLIDEKEVDDAANLFAEQRRLDSRGYPPKVWFKAGVQFALNGIQPLMVEFTEFCSSIERNRLTGLYWFNLKHMTTDQLLEEFIKSKNK